MKRILLLLFIGFPCGEVRAQHNRLENLRDIRMLNDTVALSTTEVTVLEWMRFIVNNNFREDLFPDSNTLSSSVNLLFADLRKKKDFQYIKVFDNSPQDVKWWGAKGVKGTRKMRELQKADSFYYSVWLPVVGVSFVQAKQYCAWREAIINVNRTVKLKVGLPYQNAYQMITDYTDSVMFSKKCNCTLYLFNFHHQTIIEGNKFIQSNGRTLFGAYFLRATKAGFYNIRGNVAEMTATEGVALGGSFRHFASESFATQQYTRPEDWLGFRCMFTVK